MNKRREPPFPRYALPNHAWIRTTEITPGQDVILKAGTMTLVRLRDLSWWQEDMPEPNTDAPVADVARDARRMLCVLTYRSYRDDAEAAQALASLVSDATAALWWIARNKPKLVRPYARQRFTWPVLRQARERHSIREQDVFSGIELGRDMPLELDPATSKRKWDTAAKIAQDLVDCVEAARLGHGKIGRSNEAQKLPRFSDDSAPAWWDAAKGYMLASYPNPETISEFKSLVTAPTKCKSPGRLKVAIIECIRTRFLSFAPNRSACQT